MYCYKTYYLWHINKFKNQFMGRKEFYEQMEELKLIRFRLLNQRNEHSENQIFERNSNQMETEDDHRKLLHQNEM